MPEKKLNEDFELQLIARHGTRKELRDFVIGTFLEEKPGYWKDGTKYVTHYKYFAEKLQDGRRVYILRPTFLNKGIDFQVWVEQFKDEKDGRPSHKNVLEDLRLKLAENRQEALKLLAAIEEVWNCSEPDSTLKKYKFSFKKGYSAELLLKILKWLFIEQDITYWNYDGRGMLFAAIKKEFGN